MEDGDALFVAPKSRIKLDLEIKRDHKNNLWIGKVLTYNEKETSFSKEVLCDILKIKLSKKIKILPSFIDFKILNK